MEEKRKIQDYVVINQQSIGALEVVLAEHTNPKAEAPYLCAYYEINPLFSRYTDIKTGSYLDMLSLFTTRIQRQIDNVRAEQKGRRVKHPILTKEDCVSCSGKHLKNQVVVIKAAILKPEYRGDDYQLAYVIGGFGADPETRGQRVFVKNLYTGREEVYDRSDIEGIYPKEQLPEWAKAYWRDDEAKNQRKINADTRTLT